MFSLLVAWVQLLRWFSYVTVTFFITVFNGLLMLNTRNNVFYIFSSDFSVNQIKKLLNKC